MLRRSISLISLMSFVLLVVTSVVVYFQPEGRVAYWANWRFLGLDKHQWGDLHLTLGTLLILSSAVHIWLNWTPILTYMKNKARQLRVATPPFVFALLVTLFVTVGTLGGWPPMRQLVDFSAWLKAGQAEKYGIPPYGHAELSTLTKFCDYMRMDPKKALSNLQKAGLAAATPDKTLLELSKEAGTTPSHIFDLMRGDAIATDPFSGLPPSPPQGTGKMTLKALCDQYSLPMDKAMERLKAAGFKPEPEKTIKEIAAESSKETIDAYKALAGR